MEVNILLPGNTQVKIKAKIGDKLINSLPNKNVNIIINGKIKMVYYNLDALFRYIVSNYTSNAFLITRTCYYGKHQTYHN